MGKIKNFVENFNFNFDNPKVKTKSKKFGKNSELKYGDFNLFFPSKCGKVRGFLPQNSFVKVASPPPTPPPFFGLLVEKLTHKKNSN